jgi:Zn-dependent M28 family amino/carboxypeptidase
VNLGPPNPTSIRPRGSFFIGVIREGFITKEMPARAEEFSRLRNATSPAVLSESDWSATVIAKIREPRAGWLPNAVGILEGSDPVQSQGYIVVSAHMDHVGTRCRGATPADTICNGADDDASGTVGVALVAKALSQPGARPKRSVIFLTVSAEERGLWGSQYFANHLPVDPKSIVADLNMDMIGRNWKDSVVAIGKQHSDLGSTVDRVAALHPELNLQVLDDQWPAENLYGRSDHYNFAVKGIPILFFTSGLHPDYHAVTDSPDKIDAEKEARILRLVVYLAEEIGNRAERPRWNPESYKKIVTGR